MWKFVKLIVKKNKLMSVYHTAVLLMIINFCHNIVKVVCGSTATFTMLRRNSWLITGQTRKKLLSLFVNFIHVLYYKFTNNKTDVVRRNHHFCTISFTSLGSTRAAKSSRILPSSSIPPLVAIAVFVTISSPRVIATWELWVVTSTPRSAAITSAKASGIHFSGIAIASPWARILVAAFCWVSKSICTPSSKSRSPGFREIPVRCLVIVPSSSAGWNVCIIGNTRKFIGFLLPVAHFRSNWCSEAPRKTRFGWKSSHSTTIRHCEPEKPCGIDETGVQLNAPWRSVQAWYLRKQKLFSGFDAKCMHNWLFSRSHNAIRFGGFFT